MTAEQSAIVLVHGAWGGGWMWERVVPLLEERGFTVRTLDLPSVGSDPAEGLDLSHDAAAVRKVLGEIEGPILLCGHSYGGMVISRAATGHPNVVRLVYLCAFMPDAGQSLFEIAGGEPPPWLQLLEDGTTMPDLEQAQAVAFGDCDPETAERAAGRLRPQPPAPFNEPVPVPAWREIETTYVICTLDQAIPAELQRAVFAPRADEVIELESSHSPMYSNPWAVAELLAKRAAGASVPA